VIVFNADREMLLRHVTAPGRPHGGTWAATATSGLRFGEGYAAAGARALRESLGVRASPRYVGAAWLDDDGSRRFIGVSVASIDGHIPRGGTLTAVPVERVMRAIERRDPAYDEALARACRMLEGDESA
jgi:hypothetical protein